MGGLVKDSGGVRQQNTDRGDDSSDDEKMVICDMAPKSQEKGEKNLFNEINGLLQRLPFFFFFFFFFFLVENKGVKL